MDEALTKQQVPAGNGGSIPLGTLGINEDAIPILNILVPNKPKRKKTPKPKHTWTYETVLEPTGTASRYWDSEAPQKSRRRTQR
jgi:hypothetical protein